VAGLGLLAGCGRLPGQAATAPRVFRLGRLIDSGPENLATSQTHSLTQALHELGYVEGRNLAWEYVFAEGQYERLPELATALVNRSVDVIVTGTNLTALAARAATSTIPIVMAISGDPVGAGLVASLARPGGNVTGLSSLSPQLSAKRLDLLRDALPGLTRVAVLWNGADPVKALDYRQTEAAGQALGLTIQTLPVGTVNDLDPALESASRAGTQALLVLGDGLTQGNHGRILARAADAGLPVMYEQRRAAVTGALLSYGPNIDDLYHRAASYIDKILQGTRPADLPIEQPTTFDFVINLRTAQALGLTIPPHVLLQATEVIQ
jgi:putative tryptophan/tyrosine transport system substrate-binding protein